MLTNLDIPVSYEISESRASLSPELYIVEISICVCGFVEMTDFRGTGFFFNEYGGECNKFGWSSAHAFRFPCASGDYDDGNKIIFYVRSRKVQVMTRVSMTLFVSANTHQGAECFNTESRGKQCAFMSLSVILTAERVYHCLSDHSQQLIISWYKETICM